MKTWMTLLSVLVLGSVLSATAGETKDAKAACCDKAKTTASSKSGNDCSGGAKACGGKSMQTKHSIDFSEKGGKRLVASL